MINHNKYVLYAYVLLYFLIGWQNIIFNTHDFINPTRFVDRIFDNIIVTGLIFLFTALLGFIALIGHKIIKRVWIAQILLLPQLLISFSSVVSMIIAVSIGQYNDGTVLPYHFILKDQEWCGVFFIFNLMSVVYYKF